MEHTLRENIYSLEHPILIDDIHPPNSNPLDHILYSCSNWVTHLCEIYGTTDNQFSLSGLEKKILSFLKNHFLHWLEALSLTRNLSSTIGHVKQLHKLLKKRSVKDELQEFIYDASRFMQYHAEIMKSAPMQIYASALLFSPTKSLVRTQFKGTLSSWITSTPAQENHWSPLLQTIEADWPRVASSGTNLLILRSKTKNVEIRDMISGQRVQELEHAEEVMRAVFSDSKHALTVTRNRIQIWNLDSNAVIHEVCGPDSGYGLVSNDGKLTAWKTHQGVQVCDVANDMSLTKTDQSIMPAKWSNNSRFLAVGSHTMEVFEVADGTLERKMSIFDNYYEPEENGYYCFSFSHDSKLIATRHAQRKGIEIWDLATEEKTQTIEHGDLWKVKVVEFSKDSRLIAVGYGEAQDSQPQCLVRVWDVATGQRQHELHWHQGRSFIGLAWSEDAKNLVVAFQHGSVEIYDLTEYTDWEFDTDSKAPPNEITFSTDFNLVSAVSLGSCIRIWDAKTGRKMSTLQKPRKGGPPEWDFHNARFSRDSKYVHLYDVFELNFGVWDIASGSVTSLSHTIPREILMQRAWSADGRYIASWPGTYEVGAYEVTVWNATADKITLHSTFHHERGGVSRLAFSNNAEYLVTLSKQNSVTVYRLSTGEEVWMDKAPDWVAAWADENEEDRCGTCESDRFYFETYSYSPSIAVSDDSQKVLFTEPQRHRLWIVSNGGPKVKLQICCRFFLPSFDIESPYILTQHGRINLDNFIAQAEKFIGSEIAYDYQHMTEGYGISSDQAWLTWNGKNILWLPPDYRPALERAISRNCIAMGAESSHQVNIFSFTGPPSFLTQGTMLEQI
ncbi:uncharacterized protein TRIVIDRAFT_67191 [Trichoderma virens Gv29-8]|uniref:Uncharacterized protein n=1 Tax=Hypocrea virens (strain Gv29-8 / FGSC 10586) TaxID=413071 RepID=G9N5C7_HYPVG|nr:uncharacterized protein TRIVIDRAFT_67191 [Trichoderma virens Gv29-8]EHK17972.1 hypothetical protein TRIVIDRAFT_67191 [Trichoderma virens Gv29-8]UKZ54164.1 hypothetical protein TrVGV298_007970 [Trichoderma virens]